MCDRPSEQRDRSRRQPGRDRAVQPDVGPGAGVLTGELRGLGQLPAAPLRLLVGAVARLAAGVLRPLSEGHAGAFHRYDWVADRFAREPVAVPVRPVLIVEGCGSSPRSLDPWTTLRIWVEAPEPLRTSRGLARDGAHQEPQWRRWQLTEAAEFAREDTRARADVRLDGVGSAGSGRLPLL